MPVVPTFTKRFITCPHCQEGVHTVEHLIQNAQNPTYKGECHAGPWYCDNCGHSFFLVASSDGTIDVTLHKEVSTPITVLLEIPPQQHPIVLKVAHKNYGGPVEENNLRYFYEEYTCPINYLRDVLEVSVEGDSDPHGLASYRGWFVTEDEEDEEGAGGIAHARAVLNANKEVEHPTTKLLQDKAPPK